MNKYCKICLVSSCCKESCEDVKKYISNKIKLCHIICMFLFMSLFFIISCLLPELTCHFVLKIIMCLSGMILMVSLPYTIFYIIEKLFLYKIKKKILDKVLDERSI